MPKLVPPASGVTIRMYRQGHGDCFLLALPREGGGDPVYLVIDCGFKPGSPRDLAHPNAIADIIDHLADATGEHLDLAIITHEHQDHVNGIWKKTKPYFDRFQIDEAWMAWTEDPDDDLANELRDRHKDQLLSLVAARRELALAVGEDDDAVRRVDSLLSLEFGGDQDLSLTEMLAAAEDPTKSINKQAMKLIKDKAAEHRGVRFLNPGDGPVPVPGTKVRAFVLGPPRDPDLISDEDPRGGEAFPDDDTHGFTFGAAATHQNGGTAALFSTRYRVPFGPLGQPLSDPFFLSHYGKDLEGADDRDQVEVSDNAAWRRIDSDWLFSAENLALKLNTGINNTSLVLAFELPQSKKILLFVGDAQRGNWVSWTDCTWTENGRTITARDLLGRTVLYKVGHHGSHNATLAGKSTDDYANLSWMGTGAAAAEFVAMITAVNAWAMDQKPPWVHPLPSIKEALTTKTQGRVFQTDMDQPTKPDSVTAAAWNKFLGRSVFDQAFFDCQILDQ